MRSKIHFHSDCYFFAGCENMLVVLWSSAIIRNEYDVSFSYRFSNRYKQGMESRIQPDFPVYPVSFPDLTDLDALPESWPLRLRRAAMLLLRIFSTLPLLVYEISVLYRTLRRIKPAIVHINNGGYPAALSARTAAIAARIAGVPRTVMVVNNLAADYSSPVRWLGYPMDVMVSRSVDRFVTGSRAAQRQLRTVLGLKDDQCVAIHNGIALRPTSTDIAKTRSRYGLADFSGVIFGIVAVLRPNKGHQVLLQAFEMLLTTLPETATNIRILIEGSGPLKNELLDFVRGHGLSNFCLFVGDEPLIMDFMALIDVLVLPSVDQEDFPNVILEAMGMGKPVIASRLAGTTEQVLDGETGVLVAPRDVRGLAAAVAKLALDGNARRRMGAAGQLRFREKFAAEVAARNYRSLYHSLIGNSKK